MPGWSVRPGLLVAALVFLGLYGAILWYLWRSAKRGAERIWLHCRYCGLVAWVRRDSIAVFGDYLCPHCSSDDIH
jgi:hypothetical protein